MTTKSLATEYPKEQARVRRLLGFYKELGPAGAFGVMSIEAILREADRASAEHDTVAMLRSFEALKGCE